MKVGAKHYRSIWFDDATQTVQIIDQRWLPHEFRVVALKTLDDFAVAIRDMFIINPLHAHAHDKLFSTHPSTANRVTALEAMVGKVEPIQSTRQSSIPKTGRKSRLKKPWG